MDLFKRYQELKSVFRMGKDTDLDQSPVEIRFYTFHSTDNSRNEFLDQTTFDVIDSNILENNTFQYPVFCLKSQKKANNAIIMLHGLNERSWDKYLSWAEYLCIYTERPIVLFPLAFHMNRSESGWLNIRNLFKYLPLRNNKEKSDKALSIANYVISERLSENPIRFYKAGAQTLKDLTVFIKDVKSGENTLFEEDCQIDIFAYSIGALLAQIALMANPEHLFSDTNAFLFCGGSLFKNMNGESRNIMDKTCNEVIQKFYTNNSWLAQANEVNQDDISRSFASMIDVDINKTSRHHFFDKLSDRMKIISLLKDKVISYDGIEAAVGNLFAAKNVRKMDYSYIYTHENPFPINNFQERESITNCFNDTFSIIGDFFNSKYK